MLDELRPPDQVKLSWTKWSGNFEIFMVSIKAWRMDQPWGITAAALVSWAKIDCSCLLVAVWHTHHLDSANLKCCTFSRGNHISMATESNRKVIMAEVRLGTPASYRVELLLTKHNGTLEISWGTKEKNYPDNEWNWRCHHKPYKPGKDFRCWAETRQWVCLHDMGSQKP